MKASEISYEGLIRWYMSRGDGPPKKLLHIARLKKSRCTPKIPLKESLNNTISKFIVKYEKNT